MKRLQKKRGEKGTHHCVWISAGTSGNLNVCRLCAVYIYAGRADGKSWCMVTNNIDNECECSTHQSTFITYSELNLLDEKQMLAMIIHDAS